MLNEKEIQSLLSIAVEAGEAILKVYHSVEGIDVEAKADDSPVTQADIAAHHVIVAGLARITPDIPVLSEEGGLPSYAERKSWDQYWLIDPLDGTKEFIGRNGEFTVNIALISHGEPVLGVVYVPALNITYWGAKDQGAYKIQAGSSEKIACRPLPKQGVKVVGSRRHGADALADMLVKAEAVLGAIDSVSMGSSLKLCLVAEGKADWYPRLALTCEWDTAAAQAVLEAAGGKVVDDKGEILRYNSKDKLLNPFFHAFGDTTFDWASIIL